MKKFLPIANGIALFITVVMSYLSNTGIFNDNTMGSVSAAYQNAFTPAGYAFSIWGIIYLGLLGFVIYTGRSLFTKKESTPELLKIGWWFVFSCLANSLWVLAWLYDYTGISVLLMICLLFCLWKIIANTRMELDHHPFRKYLFIFWPFALYTGWVTVALIANIAAWLTKLDWNGWGLSESLWAIIMVCIAGLINILAVRRRNLREFALVGIWALIAIAVSNTRDGGSTAVVYTCYGVSAIIFVFIILNAMKSRQRSFGRM